MRSLAAYLLLAGLGFIVVIAFARPAMFAQGGSQLVYLVALLALIGAAGFGGRKLAPGPAIGHAVIWAALFAGLALGYRLWQGWRGGGGPDGGLGLG